MRLKAHFTVCDTNSVGAALRTKRSSLSSQLWFVSSVILSVAGSVVVDLKIRTQNITTKQVSDYNHECYF